MKYKVLISRTAIKDLERIPASFRNKVKERLKELKDLGSKKLDVKRISGTRNPKLYRLRVGKYRVIFAIVEGEIRVTRILKRESVYDIVD